MTRRFSSRHPLSIRTQLRRVYYSAFSPIPDSSSKLPLIAPPLVREHRLYQADWLIRFYEFKVDELAGFRGTSIWRSIPSSRGHLRHRHLFPIDLNKAPRDLFLRIPGVGTKSVERILRLRRWHKLRFEDLRACICRSESLAVRDHGRS